MRTALNRGVSPAIFAAILVVFALPFGTVSCEGPPVHFTGYELATWNVSDTSPPATTDEGESLRDEIESQASFWAMLALCAAIAGLLLGVVGCRGGGIAAGIGLFATLILFALPFDILGGPTIEHEVGLKSSAYLFGAAVLWHFVAAISRRRRSPRAGRPSQAEVPAVPPGALPRSTSS